MRENRQEALRLTKALLEEQEAEKKKAPVIPFTLTKFSSVYQPEQVILTLVMAIMMKFSMMKNWIMILRHGLFGDSMEPTYEMGEVVLIKQTGFDYDGAIYVTGMVKPI